MDQLQQWITNDSVACGGVLLGTIYVIAQLVNQNWCAAILFIVFVGCLHFARALDNMLHIVLLSILTTMAVTLPLTTSSNQSTFVENFASKDTDTDKDKDKDKDKDTDTDTDEDEDEDKDTDTDTDEEDNNKDEANDDAPSDSEDDTDEDDKKDKKTKNGPPPSRMDAFTNPSNPTKKSPQQKEPRVDAFQTFMNTYKSLTPNQVENMTSDTRELIQTQKSLMSTVKNLAPIVSQGKEMLDTFKDYFGNSSAQDILGSGTLLPQQQQPKQKRK
jgi:hypothetical protein